MARMRSGICLQVVQPQTEPFHIEKDRCHAVVRLEAQWERAGHVGDAIREFFIADRFPSNPLEFVQNAVYRLVDILRVHTGESHPWPDTDVRVECAGAVIGQPLPFAHVFTQPPHHAELAQDVVGDLHGIVVGMGAGDGQAADDDSGLDLAGHGDRFTLDAVGARDGRDSVCR